MQSQELENVGMPLFHHLLAKMTKMEKKNKFDFFFVIIIRWVDVIFIERVNKEP